MLYVFFLHEFLVVGHETVETARISLEDTTLDVLGDGINAFDVDESDVSPVE